MRSTRCRLFRVSLLVLAAIAPPLLVAAESRMAAPEPVTRGFDPEARAEARRALADVLLAERVPVQAPAITVRLDDSDRQSLSQGDADGTRVSPAERRKRVGVVKDVALQVDFSALDAAAGRGRPAAFRGGQLFVDGSGATWTSLVRAEGATAIRLRFAGLNLPAGVELFVYNDRGDAFGPYPAAGGEGVFWSHTLGGTDAYVQLRVRGDGVANLRAIRLTISGIGVLGPDYRYVNTWGSCDNGNAGCIALINGVLPGRAPSQVQHASAAVAHMQFISGPYVYFCSGGLINDSDPSLPPAQHFFLTANHCLSRESEAASLEAYFNYVDCPTAQPPRTLGASVLSSSRRGDYTLLALSEDPPLGAMYLGWTSAPVAGSNGLALYRFSHPSGAHQAYSEHVVDTSRPTCRSWPRGSWIYSEDVYGATEGGSSGSPVVNAGGQVVGQLSGACGYNVSDSCDSVSNATVDGAFAGYFDKVSQWLDPATTPPEEPPTGGVVSIASVLLDSAGTDGRGRSEVSFAVTISPALGGATVSGSWGGLAKGSGSCVTGGNGACVVSKRNIRGSGQVTFTANGVDLTGYAFDGVSVTGSHTLP